MFGVGTNAAPSRGEEEGDHHEEDDSGPPGHPAALTALALSAGAARADEPTTIVQSESGPPTAQKRVIHDAAAYAALFQGSPPASPAVDFQKEDVLVVALGTEPRPGFSVRISDVARAGGAAVVHWYPIQPTSAAGPTPSRPFHVAKCAKLGANVTFHEDPPAPFTKLTFVVTRGKDEATLVIDGNARTVEEDDRSSGSFAGFTAPTWIEPGDWARLVSAFDAAHVATLPPTAGAAPSGNPYAVRITSEVGTETRVLRTWIDHHGAFAARVGPLVRALRTIEWHMADPYDGDEQLIEATVHVEPGKTVLVRGAERMTVDGPADLLAVLASADGKTVDVNGVVNTFFLFDEETFDLDTLVAKLAAPTPALAQPHAGAAVVKTLPAGSTIEISGEQGAYYRVQLPKVDDVFVPKSGVKIGKATAGVIGAIGHP